MRTTNEKRIRRKKSIRKKISGDPVRPRMSVFRSSKHIYVQVIDDLNGKTLAAASTRDKDLGEKGAGKIDAAKKVGELVANRCKEKGVDKVVFDRNGFFYHGRIKALADGAREAGLSL